MKKDKKIIVGDLRERLKAKLKEIIRKQMKEISTSSAAGGSPADGSAGPVKTPYAFGKAKDPTTGLDGYTKVGKDSVGTLDEKKKKDKDNKSSTAGTSYTPKDDAETTRIKALKKAADDAAIASKKANDAAATVNKLAKTKPKEPKKDN